MKHVILLFILVIFSCNESEKGRFKKIKYTRNYNYLDSLAVKIIPNQKFDYWAFVNYAEYTSGNKKYSIIKEVGKIYNDAELIKKFKPSGFFESGHPNYRCSFIFTRQKEKDTFITTNENLRSFLGIIDNLEEAILLAESYGFKIDNDIRGSSFRETTNGYELHLMKYNKQYRSKEAFEIKINKNASISFKSIGIYCKGNCD